LESSMIRQEDYVYGDDRKEAWRFNAGGVLKNAVGRWRIPGRVNQLDK
jgi:hypothetical protein